MVEHLAGLSLVEPEVESKNRGETDSSCEQHEVGHVSVAVGIEGVVSELVTIRLVVGVGFVHDQIGVGIRREDVFVTMKGH